MSLKSLRHGLKSFVRPTRAVRLIHDDPWRDSAFPGWASPIWRRHVDRPPQLGCGLEVGPFDRTASEISRRHGRAGFTNRREFDESIGVDRSRGLGHGHDDSDVSCVKEIELVDSRSGPDIRNDDIGVDRRKMSKQAPLHAPVRIGRDEGLARARARARDEREVSPERPHHVIQTLDLAGKESAEMWAVVENTK